MEKQDRSPGDSSTQRMAESVIRERVSDRIGQKLVPDDGPGWPRLDGIGQNDQTVCVEIWAHQGDAKSAQKAKVMKDMCKLLLHEKEMGSSCRKIFAVCEHEAIAFLENSWHGRFASEFGIETLVVDVPEKLQAEIRAAQKRQYR